MEDDECEQEINKLGKMKEQWEKVQLQKLKNKQFNKDIQVIITIILYQMSLKLSNNLNNYIIENTQKESQKGKDGKTMGFRQKQFENIDIKKIEERKKLFQEEQDHLGRIRMAAGK